VIPSGRRLNLEVGIHQAVVNDWEPDPMRLIASVLKTVEKMKEEGVARIRVIRLSTFKKRRRRNLAVPEVRDNQSAFLRVKEEGRERESHLSFGERGW
jgi:hypothetical protein